MRDIIVTKGAGKVLPADVQAHLAKQPGVFGYAVLTEGKITFGAGIPCSELPAYHEILQAFNTVYYFGTDAGQPYVLLKNDGDSPLMVAFLEGNFEDYHDTNNQPDTGNFVKDYLQAKIDDMSEMFDGDIGKVSKALQKNSIAAEIMAKFGKRGVCSFFDINGSHFSVAINDQTLELEWGSQSHPLLDAPADTGKPIEQKEMTVAEKLAAMRSKTATPGVHTTGATVTKLNTPLQQDIKNADALKDTTAIRADTQELVYPPEGACRSNSTLKDWYNAHFGTCPQGYQFGKGDPTKAVGMPRSMLKTSSNLRHTTGTSTVGAVTGKEIAAGTGTVKAEVVGGFPIISGPQKEAQGHFLKNIDLKSMDIMDPKKLQEIEAKASDWFDQHGVSIDDFMHFPPEKIRELVVKWPNDAQLLIETLRYKLAIRMMNDKKPVTEAPSTPAAKSNSVADRLAAMREKKAS